MRAEFKKKNRKMKHSSEAKAGFEEELHEREYGEESYYEINSKEFQANLNMLIKNYKKETGEVLKK